MTREQFEENNKGVYVLETNQYLNHPGIYAIIVGENNVIAYKNPCAGKQIQGATEWAKSCHSIEEAYQEINDYIESLINIEKPKQKIIK